MDTTDDGDKTPELTIADSGSRLRRRFYTEEQKRQIVAETLIAGASVARIARQHGINANVVFTWRKQMRQVAPATAALLPVQVAPAPIAPPPKRRRGRKPVAEAGFIEIELAGGHRLRVHGTADARTLRGVIEALSR
jgi:transposase